MKKYIVNSLKNQYVFNTLSAAIERMQALNMIGSKYSFQVEEVQG